MAEVSDNIILEGLRGSLGRKIVLRRGRRGQTIVSKKPVFAPDREFSDAQKAHQHAFREATAYAKSVKGEEFYLNRAKQTDQTSYNLAVADWFREPLVLEIDRRGWTGEIGQTFRIKAVDDLMVTHVSVVIHDHNGEVLEAGEAVQSSTDGTWWVYTVQRDFLTIPVSVLTATAEDLPGHRNSMAISL